MYNPKMKKKKDRGKIKGYLRLTCRNETCNMFYEKKTTTTTTKGPKKEKKTFATVRVEPQTSEVEG